MKKILFTKEIPSGFLKQNLSQDIDFDVTNFLEIEIYSKDKIIPLLDDSIHHYLITSQNAVEAIQDLDLEGSFYVVGQKTAGKLAQNNFKVEVVKNYASELAEYLLTNDTPKNWLFFCGNNRREVLFEKLVPNGHFIKEILCYDSIPVEHDLKGKIYNAVAFFSPLGLKSYLKKNDLSAETVVFSIGRTTSEEVEKHTNNKIITAEIPILESVLTSINQYFYVEK